MTPLLSHADAQTILRKAFPTCNSTISSITELPATFNSIFILTLNTGSRYVLKVSPPPLTVRVLHNDINIISAEASLLTLLSSSSSPSSALPTPTLHLHDASCTLLPAPYLLLSHIPGFPSAQKSLEAVEETHRILSRQLPPASAQGFGRVVESDGGRTYARWRECFGALLEAALRDGEDMALLLPYAQIRAQTRRVDGALDAITEPALVVIDFGANSMLTSPDGKRLEGVIDFERAIWGDIKFARFYREMEARGEERVRGLLYAVYHAVVRILETFYYAGDTEVEMEERRRLVVALKMLEAVA